MGADSYVHGYQPREADRLLDQAGALAEWLYGDTVYAAGRQVLEAGCGVGAQAVLLAQRNPQAQFTGIDLSAASLGQAQRTARRAGLANVRFVRADLAAPPFAPGCFDDVFVCFVLEHMPEPAAALTVLAGLLRPGGTMTAIEGDHGSTCFHPRSEAALAAVQGGSRTFGSRRTSCMSMAAVRSSPMGSRARPSPP